ncbi:unnamed protein product [Symbiodinium necroappetens]|uniref:Uncharacterized protein n=1 Tax=Symbiodinium necroappetens TaxID=1628268 RepID=A0A812YHU5_9DINO|nr:unnamed protein product [Symbiodinium necroappetens]
MVSNLRSDTGAAGCQSAREKTPSNPPMAVPKARSERQKVNIAAELHLGTKKRPATPSEDAVSMPLSSRPTTGSVRRFPISAAANLAPGLSLFCNLFRQHAAMPRYAALLCQALTKKRLKERGMM